MDYKKIWKANAKQVSASDTLKYLAIKAVKSKQTDKMKLFMLLIERSFTPSKKKPHPYDAVRLAQIYAHNDYAFFVDTYIKDILSLEEVNEVKKLLADLRYNTLGDYYMYFAVRTDLNTSQQLVQAAHVATVVGRQESWPAKADANYVKFVVLAAKDERELYGIKCHAKENDVQMSEYRDGYYNNSITAIASTPIHWSKKHIFKNYKLLRH